MESIGQILKGKSIEQIKDGIAGLDMGNQQENHSDNLTFGNCPVCHGACFVHPLLPNSKPDYSRVVHCRCQEEEMERDKMAHYMKMCAIPEEFKDKTFENFIVKAYLKDAYDSALELAEGRGLRWLTLMSDVDIGKTHLAVAICNRWLAQKKPARYVYVPLLMEELRAGYDAKGDESYDALFDFFCNVPLLVLDDLGTENPTRWVQEKLDTIVDYRYAHGLALVVTTNLHINELPVRIASRLKRFNNGRVIGIDGPEAVMWLKKRKK